ncbi:unnamed protein product [Rhizophagus irregularis]|nr:unnamed protein product [Rhizophagus irregularis]
MSQRRWACNAHHHKIIKVHRLHGAVRITQYAHFYQLQLAGQASKQLNKDTLVSETVKQVHSNRLGIGYTVTIQKYNNRTDRDNKALRQKLKIPPDNTIYLSDSKKNRSFFNTGSVPCSDENTKHGEKN